MKKVILLMPVLSVLSGNFLFADDGVLEINQACALNGCGPGDAPGFPVFIKEPGSYRLTGNLDLTGTPGTTGVQIASPFVTLDLNGFEIAGPKVCTGSGPTLNCGPVEDGSGILIEADSRAAVVRNGTVRNMGVTGIWGFSDGLTIENVRAIHNGGDGFLGESNTLVSNSVAIENGEDGFDFEFGSVLRGVTAFGNGDDGIEIDGTGGVVDNSTANNNGNRGFHLAYSCTFGRNGSRENVNPDQCGGGICSSKRRYYLTTGVFLGGEADNPSNCDAGFHFASIGELSQPSALIYDTVLGHTLDDSGQGPPNSQFAWIRTGGNASESTVPGDANCNNWGNSTGDYLGTRGSIGTSYLEVPVQLQSGGLRISSWPCDFEHRVWCVED